MDIQEYLGEYLLANIREVFVNIRLFVNVGEANSESKTIRSMFSLHNVFGSPIIKKSKHSSKRSDTVKNFFRTFLVVR